MKWFETQVIDKCAANNLRRRLFCETDLKLDGLLQIASNLCVTTIKVDSEQPLQHVNQIVSDSESHENRRKKKRSKKSKNSAARTTAQNRVCVSVAVMWKIRHVLQSENSVGTVESKNTLLQFAKCTEKDWKKNRFK